MIKRLREKYTEEQLSQVYSTPHNSSRWEDHNIRVSRTIEFAKKNFPDVSSGADLSAGDARIINALELKETYIGDYAAGYQFTGLIEKTILEIPNVDLFINSETLEHLDDPGHALSLIRKKTKGLILSTPVNKFDDNNPEHYWAWDYEGIESLLVEAGFTIIDSDVVSLSENFYYDFQLMAAK